MGDRLAVLFFGFGSLWMLARMVPKETLGVWMVFMGFVATVEVARAGLIQNALIRFLTSEPAESHGAIYGGAWLLNLGLAVVGAGLMWVAGPYIETAFHAPGLATLTRVYAATFLATTPLWQYNYLQQAHLEFRGPFWATLLRYSTMFALTAAMFFGILDVGGAFAKTLEVLAYGQLLAATLGALISYRYARAFLPERLRFDWAWSRRLVGFGKYVFGTNLSAMLYKWVDTAMLGALLASATPMAIYGLAVRITNFVDVPTQAVASIVFPESSRLSATAGAGAQARMYERAVAAILAFTLPALLVVGLLPGLLVRIVGGDGYLETIPVLQVTVLYSLFIPFANQFGTLLDASGSPQLNFRYTAAGMALNVLFNYLCISRFGVMGAPLGTLLSYVVMFAAMQWLLARRFGVSLTNVARALPATYAQAFRFAQAKVRPAV